MAASLASTVIVGSPLALFVLQGRAGTISTWRSLCRNRQRLAAFGIAPYAAVPAHSRWEKLRHASCSAYRSVLDMSLENKEGYGVVVHRSMACCSASRC